MSEMVTSLLLQMAAAEHQYAVAHILLNIHVISLPIDSITRLTTVWRKTGKIIRTAIFNTYAQL